MAISPDLLHRLQQLIADAHSAFVVNYLSPKAVPPATLERLRRLGMLNPKMGVLRQAYLLGRLLQRTQTPLKPTQVPPPGYPPRQPAYAMGQTLLEPARAASGTVPTGLRIGAGSPFAPQAGEPAGTAPPPAQGLRVGGKPSVGVPVLKDEQGQQISHAAMEEVLGRNPIPLTPAEQRSLEVAEAQAGQYIVGLGNRVAQQTGQIMREVDTKLDAAYRKTVRDAVARNIARRESVSQLRSDLGHALGDWGRDLDRISVTEKQNAMQLGYANGVGQEHGENARMYRIVTPSACTLCRTLYLEPDGKPRVFRLADVRANGSNVGKKGRAQQKAVLEATHPNCSCSWNWLPDNLTPDARGRLRFNPGSQKSSPPVLSLKKAHLRRRF